MYSGYGFRKSEIGDVDVVVHNGEYHLFHLTLPNHDYIAHAVSRDGLHWRRVKNALFISDPPAWDDDMLWTMHVSRDPHRPRLLAHVLHRALNAGAWARAATRSRRQRRSLRLAQGEPGRLSARSTKPALRIDA